MALNRIRKEIINLNRYSNCNIYLIQVDENDLYHYHTIFLGPDLSPYGNGIFYLNIIFPKNYPFKPPKCSFLTPIYHPNIDKNGKISLDILEDQWSPAITIEKLVLSIISLLTDPNPDKPLVPEIANLYKTNKIEYYKKAHEFAVKYAFAPKYDKIYYLEGEERIDYELNHLNYGENIIINKCEDKYKCKICVLYGTISINFNVKFPKNYPWKPAEIILTTRIKDSNLLNKITSFIYKIKWNEKLFLYDIFKEFYNFLCDKNPTEDDIENNEYLYMKEKKIKIKTLFKALLMMKKENEKKTFNKIEKTNEIQFIIKSNKENKENKENKIKDEQSNNFLLIKNELTYEDYNQIINKKIGIINLGNTCYINSCLQTLIHCPLFIPKLLQQKKLTNNETLFTNHFLNICYQMKKATNEIDITPFKKFLGSKYQLFEGSKQNDAVEFCRKFLENISTELNVKKNNNLPFVELTNSFSKPKRQRYEISANYHRQREKSIITDLFYSFIGKTLKCQCNQESYVFNKYLDIPLQIPDNINITNINELLRNFFKIDYVEKYCNICKKEVKCDQDTKIAYPPDILILSIQRFKENNVKNNCNVIADEFIDLNEFIDYECGYNGQSLYCLFGVINHFGNMDFGHYFSYIKVDNQDWYEFNDRIVKPTSNFDTSNAYILIYTKIH